MRFLFFLLITGMTSLSAMEVVDDAGHKLTLDKPAQTIISLAPHATELLFEAGAGKQIIGVVQYSNFPDAAKRIPLVGGYKKLDLERIVSMQPDLIIGWQSGNQASELAQLQQLGLNVFLTEPRKLSDIANLLQRLGKLTGNEVQANKAAAQFMQRYHSLQQRYQNKKSLRAFYQVWDQPLMTINGKHLISDVMRLCGLENVFANVGSLVPRVNQEAVLETNPQMIVAGGIAKHRPDWIAEWKKWPNLSAVRLDGMVDIQPDIIQRHSPRILLGAEQLCRNADEIRKKLEQNAK